MPELVAALAGFGAGMGLILFFSDDGLKSAIKLFLEVMLGVLDEFEEVNTNNVIARIVQELDSTDSEVVDKILEAVKEVFMQGAE